MNGGPEFRWSAGGKPFGLPMITQYSLRRILRILGYERNMGRFTVDNGIAGRDLSMGIDYLQYADASMNDVALVTPLRDGINHVAKEYIAARTGRTGFLISVKWREPHKIRRSYPHKSQH